MPLAEIYIINIYIPFSAEVTDFLQYKKFEEEIKANFHLKKFLGIIKKHSPIGVIGNYRCVVELSFGYEGYTPIKGSRPTKGDINQDILIPNFNLKTFADIKTPMHKLESFIDEIATNHPWEHPVITVETKKIWDGLNNNY